MAMHMLDKMQFLKDLKHTEDGFCDYQGDFFAYQEHQKYSKKDVLELLSLQLIKILEANEIQNPNFFRKLFLSLCSFLEHLKYFSYEMSEEEIKRLEKILQFQDEYEKRFPSKEYGFNLNFLEFENLICQFSKKEENVSLEDSQEELIWRFKQQITELESCIKRQERAIKSRNQQHQKSEALEQNLRKQLADTKQILSQVQQELSCKNEENNILLSQKKELEEQLESLQNRVRKLNEYVEDVNREKDSYESKKSALKKDYERRLSTLKKQNESLQNEIQVYSSELTNYREQIESKRVRNKNDSIICEFLISLLYKGSLTVETAKKELEEIGLNLTKEEVSTYLSMIKKRINVTGPIFKNFPPYYEISKNCKTVSSIILSSHKKTLDIFLYSDTHFSNTSENLSFCIDQVNNYCIQNSIPYIVHLGDFVHLFRLDQKLTVEQLKIIEKFLRQLRKDFLICSELYYGFLGGNHDRHFIPYGVDPIDWFTRNFENCFSLGYGHALIMLNQSKNKIQLHHPSLSIRQEKDGNIDSYLTKYYKKSDIRRSDIYFDFLGHIHNSYISFNKGYGLVPSLCYDRTKNGAWHVTFYFDAQGNIDYLIIKNLSFQDNFTLEEELAYDKQRIKQR